MSEHPPAGWYPSPGEPENERWWTGDQWGQEIRAIAAVAAPPQPATVPIPAPAMQPAPAAQPASKNTGCFGIARGVMLGIIGAIVLLVGGCTALVYTAYDDSDLVSVTTSVRSTAAPVETEPAIADDAAVETTDQEPVEPTEEEEDGTETSEADDAIACNRIASDAIVIEVVNNSPKTSSYWLTVAFFDDSGQRLADETAFVNNLRPGERSIEEQFTFEERGTACEIIDVDRFAAESEADELDDVGICEILGADFFDDFEATVSVTNDTPETSDYSVEVAFVGPDGVRIGSGSTFIESVRTGETAPGDVFSSAPFAEGYACEVVGVDRSAS